MTDAELAHFRARAGYALGSQRATRELPLEVEWHADIPELAAETATRRAAGQRAGAEEAAVRDGEPAVREAEAPVQERESAVQPRQPAIEPGKATVEPGQAPIEPRQPAVEGKLLACIGVPTEAEVAAPCTAVDARTAKDAALLIGQFLKIDTASRGGVAAAQAALAHTAIRVAPRASRACTATHTTLACRAAGPARATCSTRASVWLRFT